MSRTFLYVLIAVTAAGLAVGCEQETGDNGYGNGGNGGNGDGGAAAREAPAFTLPNQNGEQVSLSDFEGRVVVLAWTNPECPYIVRHLKARTMTDLANEYADDGVVFLAINSNGHWDVAKNKQWHDGAEVPYSVLVDQSGEVGKAYGAKTTPHMFILNADHEIVYEGAIDDDVGGEKADPVNYVDKALAQLTADEELTVADTKPYGCSVKYKK